MSRFGTITVDIQITGLRVRRWRTQLLHEPAEDWTADRTHTLVVSWPSQSPPLDTQRSHFSLAAAAQTVALQPQSFFLFFYYPPNPDISGFIKLGRYAYHELFWHGDLLIFTGNISCHQSAPGVVDAGRLQGWGRIQIIWGAIMSDVCAHLIKAPVTHCCRGRGCTHQKTKLKKKYWLHLISNRFNIYSLTRGDYFKVSIPSMWRLLKKTTVFSSI